MAGSIPFRLSPAVLAWARLSIGLTSDEAAKKANVPKEQYQAWEEGNKIPTYKQLETLAYSVYKRPLAILLLPEPPKEDSIQKDFRNLTNSQINNLSSEIRLALRKAKRFQAILEEINIDDKEAEFKNFKISTRSKPEVAAEHFRDFLKFDLTVQKSWRHTDAFNNFKQLVESIGIYVFQIKMPIEEARAFCLTGKFPIIVLNTEDSSNGRIFSLFHETCHILFNEGGVFKDPETGKLKDTYSNIEDFCNKFAAAFLVPDEVFKRDINYPIVKKDKWTDSEVESLSKSYNVSREVILRKIWHLKLISDSFFWAKKRQWDSYFRAAKEAEKQKRKGEDQTGFAQDIRVLSEKGRSYTSRILNAYDSGIISTSDLTSYLETKLEHIYKIRQRLSA
jgi:Zn-dependent peptidase ImmA (M78 family)